MERYLYVSNSKSRPFRMRTYLFRFGRKRSHFDIEDAVQLWCGTPLQCITKEGVIPIVATTTEVSLVMEKSSYSNLQKLVEALGGVHKDEFYALLPDAEYGRRVRAVQYGADAAAAPAPAPEPVPSTKKPAAKNGESLQVLLDMLRAAAKGEKELAAAKADGVKALGIKGKSKMRKIGSMFARTHGKFTPNFLGRLRFHGMLNAVLLAELASIYMQLDGKEVSVEGLLKEANAS